MSEKDYINLNVDEPLKTIGSWCLVDSEDDTLGFPHWRQAFESLFEFTALALEEKWPLPEGTQAHAVLSGDMASAAWNGGISSGLGFHAIVARQLDEEEYEEFLDVPDAHVCHVNVPAHQRLADDDLPDEATVLAALATLPHEMAHVTLFARHTGGKTPLELFDEGGGELALIEALKCLESDAMEQTGSASRYGGNEDVVEGWANSLVDQWHARVPQAPEFVDRLVASLDRPAVRRRSSARSAPRRRPPGP